MVQAGIKTEEKQTFKTHFICKNVTHLYVYIK
jgi:hypothetical protein